MTCLTFPTFGGGCDAAAGRHTDGSTTTDIVVAVSAVRAYFHPATDNCSLPEMRGKPEEMPLLQIRRYSDLGMH